MEYAIQVNNLTKNYHDFSLKDVTFHVPKGSIMGFVGQNGSGKTTTIKSLLNLIQLDGGNILIENNDSIIGEKKIKEIIGVIFDECCFPLSLTIKEIDKIMKAIYAENWQRSHFLSYTKSFKLPQKKPIKEYSRGMKKKLSLAVALSHNAKVLILDEPTSGLDPVTREEILTMLMDFIQDEEHTVFLSSHITSDLEKIADYITFIHEGRIVLTENKDNLIYNYGIIKCSEKDLSYISKDAILGIRRGHFGCEVLTNHKREFEKENMPFVIDKANIEDILLFMVKGGKA